VRASDVAGATSNGFWANKGAVAGTFTFLTLIMIGVFIAIGANLTKKRRYHRRRREHQRRARRHVNDYEKQPTVPSLGGPASAVEDPEPGMSDLTAQVPMSAYPTHDVRYGGSQPAPAGQQMYQNHQYNTNYVTNDAYGNQHQQHYQQGEEEFDAYAGYDASYTHDQHAQQQQVASSAHPFSDARHSLGPHQAPPVQPGRANVDYDVDSYYGGDVSSGHAY
jgi:hypothetical protein